MFDGNSRKGALRSGGHHGTVIVTVAIVRMMQVACHQVIHMIAVRHGFVATLRTVHMTLLMSAAGVLRRTRHRVARVHRKRVLIHVVAVRRVQMPVVQIIHVIVVHDGGMAAVFTVHVGVKIVDLVVAHAATFILERAARAVKPLLVAQRGQRIQARRPPRRQIAGQCGSSRRHRCGGNVDDGIGRPHPIEQSRQRSAQRQRPG